MRHASTAEDTAFHLGKARREDRFFFVFDDNIGQILNSIALLERLQKTQKVVFKPDDQSKLESALGNVFNKLKLPLGLLHDGIPDTPAAA